MVQSIAEDTATVSLGPDGSTLPKIGAAEAANYYDQTVIVTGQVAQVTIRPKVIFLNLDRQYPHSPFTVVIFRSHSSFYGNVNALRGHSIEIQGKIRNYQDKPEMALADTNQLTVLGVTNLSLFLAPRILQTTNSSPESLTNFPEIM